MKHAICSMCASEKAVGEMLALDQKLVCRPCAEMRAKEAKVAGHNLEFSRVLDPTICSKCTTDYGSSHLPLIGGAPFCTTCSQQLYAHPFPGWLKSSLAGLLLILPVALWRGFPYFKAGRHLVLAERAMDRADYRQASSQFAEVLKVKPTEQKVILLGAKANLMVGDVEEAQKFLNQRENFDDDELFKEVSGQWKQALSAYDKAERASKLVESHQEEAAARLMHEASNDYPQSPYLADVALSLDAGAAFERKDYDAFLQISKDRLLKSPQDPAVVAAVASALACKYAVTGHPEFRSQAEQFLEKARVLSQQSPEAKVSFDEYAERIRYRLDKRDIIDKDEYDRRFRQKEAKR